MITPTFPEMNFEATLAGDALNIVVVERCPACGCAETTGSRSHSEALIEPAGGEQFLQPAYDISCCSSCGLYYKTAVLSAGELSRYYSVVDFRKWETVGHYPTERAAIDFLGRLPAGSSVLDFGCSTGRLLAGLTGVHQCFGFEINSQAADVAARKGLQMLSKEAVFGENRAFDCVVLCDVFEHFDRPVETVSALAGRIKPGGSLLMVTGNADCDECQRCPAQFWYFRTPQHLCMLSRRHAEYMSELLKLEILVWQPVCHYDLGWQERLFQHLRSVAYWNSRPTSPRWRRGVIRKLPVFRRALGWRGAPEVTCTLDHVVVAFRKI